MERKEEDGGRCVSSAGGGLAQFVEGGGAGALPIAPALDGQRIRFCSRVGDAGNRSGVSTRTWRAGASIFRGACGGQKIGTANTSYWAKP